MKTNALQRLIIFSTILFALSLRACKYLYSKNIQPLIANGNYGNINSIFAIIFFILAVLVLISSIIGFVRIIVKIVKTHKETIVEERFVVFLLNCFWTLLISLIIGLFLKILIWP